MGWWFFWKTLLLTYIEMRTPASISDRRHNKETGLVLSFERRREMEEALPSTRKLSLREDTLWASKLWTVLRIRVGYKSFGPVVGGSASLEKTAPKLHAQCPAGFLMGLVLLFASLGLCKWSGCICLKQVSPTAKTSPAWLPHHYRFPSVMGRSWSPYQSSSLSQAAESAGRRGAGVGRCLC